jgi:hypothetical protein
VILAVIAGGCAVVLIEVVGPFSDRTHLALPVVIGSIPALVLVNSVGIDLVLIPALARLVALVTTGLLLRRWYARTDD